MQFFSAEISLQTRLYRKNCKIWRNHTCGLILYTALADRFCVTRSLLLIDLLEGGRPQNWGYAMYPQRSSENVLGAIGVVIHDAFALVTAQRKTLEAPRFDLTKPQDEQVLEVNDSSTTTTLLPHWRALWMRRCRKREWPKVIIERAVVEWIFLFAL